MTDYEVASGYVLPYVLKSILGKGAVGSLLLVIYLAVTSTLSAQMVSVASICCFDIFKYQLGLKGSMIRVAHIGCVVFGFGISGFCILLHELGVTMTWVTYIYLLSFVLVLSHLF